MNKVSYICFTCFLNLFVKRMRKDKEKKISESLKNRKLEKDKF